MHDDVIDRAATRRGAPSVHRLLGNKTAVMGGDFLLARATVLLARLGNNDVVQLMARTIDEMVAGELMQATETRDDLLDWDHYLHKTYRKTAALICLSCESVAVLGGHPPATRAALSAYGRHLGLAFQLVDDMLDLTGSASSLGKPAGHDMAEGHATALALYALEVKKREAEKLLAKYDKKKASALARLRPGSAKPASTKSPDKKGSAAKPAGRGGTRGADAQSAAASSGSTQSSASAARRSHARGIETARQ